jgi:phosphopantothenoylcysteine synthetase/decarboxylase
LTVLYVISCGSPVARDVGRLVALAHQRSYDVCVVTTPDGRKFVDVPALAEQTGHPVRSFYKQPGEPDLLPSADAFLVAPASVNTINKWAAGIADTLALGMLIEAYGLEKPVVAMPFTTAPMARFPAFQESLAKLRLWGVRVLYGDDVIKLDSGEADGSRPEFPWHLGLDALESR